MTSSARTSTDKENLGFEQVNATSSPQSLSKAVYARRTEYTRPKKIRIKIGSWNVAACPGTENDLGAWFVDGKGIDQNLSGLKVSKGIDDDQSEDRLESVGLQEQRFSKVRGTVPRGDEGSVPGGEEIGIFVLGLQEVVDLNSAREYIGRVYTDTEPTSKWRKALLNALPPGYVQIVEHQLSGLLLYVYASPTIAPTISSVSTVPVGTGIMGYLGNKGAVSTRIVLGETTRLVFINSHLASGSDASHLDRRYWDVTQILQRTHFDPISWAGVLEDSQEGIGDEDFAFWFGDLNFRLDELPGDDIRRILMLHTKGEYDLGQKSRNKIEDELNETDDPIVIHTIGSDSDDDESETQKSISSHGADDSSSNKIPDPDDFVQDPSQDPASLQATLDSLIPHDQLKQAQKKRKAFHDGWREGPITFLPTYKYDVGTMGVYDSSEKKRAPSWCDRVLFRTRKDKLEFEEKLKEEELARIKDEEMKQRGIDHAADDENVLFDYNPEEDGADEAPTNDYDEYEEDEVEATEEVITKEGYLDKIHLDVYTSHQRILSSDHKPLDAIFTLEYDAVDPELKSKIQQEVARDLDRAENEGRPGITVVVDNPTDSTPQTDDSPIRRTSSGVDGVEFGKVAYQERKVRNLTIANTGQVPATFAFVERPSENGQVDQIGPPWLSVSFSDPEVDADVTTKDTKKEVTLEPGESINAVLEIFVEDFALVRELNEEKIQFDDVLVLRVTEGRDHFVPVRATWLQSCFGRSIPELIRIPEGGVRALLPRYTGSGGPVNRGQEVCWSAPRELFKLTEIVESLTDRVIAESHMLETTRIPKESPGWPFDPHSWVLQNSKERESRKRYVFDALDGDKNLNEAFPPEIPALEKLETVAEILTLFLSSLTDGIVTGPLWAKLETDITARGAKQLTDPEEIKSWVLDVLSTSPNHNISFVFLTSMLCRVAAEVAPVSKAGWKESMTGSARSGLDAVRRSLSWKGKPPPLPSDPAVLHRHAVEKAYSDILKDVIFKGPGPGQVKEKERKAADERRRDILETFLRGGRGLP